MGILLQPGDQTQLEAVGFEGFEKRLEVEFFHSNDRRGLRALSRLDLDEMLSAARCTIVSELSNSHFDSYILSESSLFVYPHKVILKTCGTTMLLQAVPVLLSHAQRLQIKVKGCRYSRGSFIFPDEQPYPHRCFSDEVEFLDKYFGNPGCSSKAVVMGDVSKQSVWHVYSVTAMDENCDEAVYTVEMCMTQLDKNKALNFFKTTWNTANEMTWKSGVRGLLPNSQICDFAFDPCGYSMNSIEDCALSTIHVTPESGFSYASFEVMGYDLKEMNFEALVDRVLCCFEPAEFSISIRVNGLKDEFKRPPWGMSLLPHGYACGYSSIENLMQDEVVLYHCFKKDTMPISRSICMEMDYLKGCQQPLKLQSGYCDDAEQVILAIDPVLIGTSDMEKDEFIKERIIKAGAEDAFYVMDIGQLLRLWKIWKTAMPRVHPFYAVKCNADKALLALLSALGAGFDVASKAELEVVQSLGVCGDRIIFANPCKLPSHITYATEHGVHLTTFDSEAELYKLKKINPHAEVVLRICVCDPGARCPLGVKYGALIEECEALLLTAKSLGLQVVGVAFHVGSGASDPCSFATGIAQAREVFDMAISLGLTTLRLLDIGGGFVSDGGQGVCFAAASQAINEALDKYFPPSTCVTVLAEPGRFFAEDMFTLAAQVFGSRMRYREGQPVAEYWINDGIYGSMNCLLYDHAVISVRPLAVVSRVDCSMVQSGRCQSTIFGPTCDGLDTLMQGVWLPYLQCGDWLVFPRMGAYTKAAASCFNGFDISDIITTYVCSI